ncbi:MAG TPA: GAF domain-containing protein [Syntrophales bacterium]|nr:GAF domain-containing protein [Syntrophales bacterium]HQG34015.1 GAF domain-containing protein [Syntrophales bacterium]HQI35382.1 GAF domain-containing protein [Syntrophales bacterium]HQJ29817.1 GAF domain-containing protein [Syntrophales bacterium]HRR46888.1 GAF domain-containing protein [Syntrophales bacterium]
MNIKELLNKSSLESRGLYYRLTIIFSLFFLFPLLGFFFFAFRYDILDDEYIPVFTISLLIFYLFGYTLVRRIFDTIIGVARKMSASLAEVGMNKPSREVNNELEELVTSFQVLEKDLRSSVDGLSQKSAQIATLKELSDLCYVTFDAEDLFYITLERALRMVNADVGSVLLLEYPGREAFIVRASIGLGGIVKKGDRVDFAASIAKFAVINKSPLLVNDIENDSRFGRKNREQYGTKSFLCMPLKGIHEVIGVLTLSRRSAETCFTQEDADILTPLLSNAAFTYDNLSLLKENEEQKNLIKVMDMGFKMIGAKSMDLDIIHAYLYQIRNAVPFDLAGILIAGEEEHDTLQVFDYLAYIPTELGRERVYPYRGTILEKVMQQGGTLIVNNPEPGPTPVERDLLDGHGLKSLCLAPLQSEGKPVGILFLGSQQEGAFRGRNEGVDLMANLISLAIDRSRMAATLGKRDREMDLLKQIGGVLASSTFDMAEVIKHTMQMIQTVIDVEAGSLLLRQGDRLLFKESFNVDQKVELEVLKNTQLMLGQGIAGFTATRGEPILIKDVTTSQYFYPHLDQKTGFVTRSVLCVPLIAKGQVLGVIEVLNKRRGEFNTGDMQLLQSIGTSVSIALENARLYQETLAMAEQERCIRGVFQKFVPKEVVDRIVHNVDTEQPVTEEMRVLTMINIDLREFSQLSIKIGPRKTVTMLNLFFRVMGEIIFKHRGIVDKYLGDGFLAVFGAPVSYPADADNAIAAALEMKEAMGEINVQAVRTIGVPLVMGISIHTGEAVVGNIGFEKKMDYSVIGDSVNIVFRLQSLTKKWPNSILITEKTLQSVINSTVAVREIAVVDDSSQIGHLRVYEVIGQQYKDAKN